MRKSLALSRFVLTVGVVACVLSAVSFAGEKNTPAAGPSTPPASPAQPSGPPIDDDGQVLPSAYYMPDDVQYYPPPKPEPKARYAALMNEYGRLLSQDLTEEQFREVVHEAEALVAVTRAKHQLADAIRTLEMVQKNFRQAKAADDAARLLKALPHLKDLQLEHQVVPSPSSTPKPKASKIAH